MTTPMPEQWLPVPIPEFAHLYEVSDLGRVRRIAPAQGTRVGRIIGGRPNRDGYLRVNLCDRTRNGTDKLIHVLVLEAFVGPCPSGMEACHGDGDPGNAALSNLRWDTPIANAADRKRHGTHKFGECHPNARLTDSQIAEIRAASGSQKSIARLFGISQQHVSDIKRGQRRAA